MGKKNFEISENFVKHYKSAIGQAKGKILLILDEIENISPGTASSENWRTGNDPILFWQNIRSFIQTDEKSRLSVCIVGTSPVMVELPKINEIANPIYMFTQKRFIRSFEFEETRLMINTLGYFMGLDIRPELIMDLQKTYGGHPFFIRQVCSKLHQLCSNDRPHTVSERELTRAKEDFEGQLQSYLSDILNNIKEIHPDEYELLSSVVWGDLDEITEIGNEAPELIDHLIGYGIVSRTSDGFDIRFDALRKALHKHFAPSTSADRWAEISKRRNALERDIRSELHSWSRYCPTGQFEEILKQSLTELRFLQLESIEPSILFSRERSPLYMSDVIGLLKNINVMPFLEDRRSDIAKCIQVINTNRTDAHAKFMSDEDYEETILALAYLEGEFNQP